ncbi:MAG: FkbM family methyltransferase [Roseococcus sp.]
MTDGIETILGASLAEIRACHAATRSAVHAAAAGGRLLLVGSGNMAQAILRGVRAAGADVAGLIEYDARFWGRSVMGLDVLQPAEAARRFGTDALCIAAVWSPDHCYAETKHWLGCFGFTHVLPAQAAFWCFADEIGPYYQFGPPELYLDCWEEIAAVHARLTDAESRSQFAGMLRWRLLMDEAALPQPHPARIYFDGALVRVGPETCVADIGAYTGDTLQTLLRWTGDAIGRVIAYEPDPQNFERLERYVGTLPAGLRERIECRQAAVSSSAGTISFEPSGKPGTIMTGAGSVSVPCIRLDDEFSDRPVDYLKFDVEGFEWEALAGGLATIARCQPALGLSIYHKPDDLFRLPLRAMELCPGHRFHMRAHDDDGIDFILYAVPPRMVPT